MVLGDLGADVVKVEDPALGDYLRMMPPMAPTTSGQPEIGARFAALNRGKRSLTLDLKQPLAREAFLRMAERAQVVVETFRPGVLDRLGIGFEALRQCNGRIVLCSISGYGQTGPWRDRAGHDLNYIATAGVLAQSGRAGESPQVPGVQVGDCAGALWGVIGIVAALYAGEAKHVDISMTEAAMTFLVPILSLAINGLPTPERGTDHLTGGTARYGVYPTRDGHLAVGALEPKFWAAFCGALGHGANPSHAELTHTLGERTKAEWLAAFQGKEVCCEPVVDPSDIATHELHRARHNVFENDGVRYLRTPLGLPETARAAPQLGEHSVEVLREYGFSEDEVTKLR